MQRLQHSRKLLRHALVHPSMEVDGDIDPSRLGFLYSGDRILKQRRGVDPVEAFRSIHLHGSEALCTARSCSVRHVVGFVASDPAVDLDAVAHLPPEELPDGYAEPLPFDVPEGDV